MTGSTSDAGSEPVAVVSGCDISGYGIVRSLGRHRIAVAALTDHTQDFARFSRYCCDTIDYPPMSGRFSANCPSLQALLDQRIHHRIDVVLVSPHALGPLSPFRSDVGQASAAVHPPESVIHFLGHNSLRSVRQY